MRVKYTRSRANSSLVNLLSIPFPTFFFFFSDLKPANIFFREIDGRIALKIGDFGLSQVIQTQKPMSHNGYDQPIPSHTILSFFLFFCSRLSFLTYICVGICILYKNTDVYVSGGVSHF